MPVFIMLDVVDLDLAETLETDLNSSTTVRWDYPKEIRYTNLENLKINKDDDIENPKGRNFKIRINWRGSIRAAIVRKRGNR